MANILVTGGLGFVGERLIKKLVGEQHRIWVSSRKKTAKDKSDFLGIHQGILHEQLLQKDNFPEQIDIVIHLAALNEATCEKFPAEAIDVNVNHTRLILDNAIYNGVSKFIYFSTSHIYGINNSGSMDELTIPKPMYTYAITHKAAEDYVIAAHLKNKIKAVVIRLSNAFGAPVTPDVNCWSLLVNDLCKQAVSTNELKLKSNGCQYRDFICLTDVENTIAQMVSVSDQKNIVYNLCSGKSIKVKDMAAIIAKQYKKIYHLQLPIIYPDGAAPTNESYFNFSIDRLTAEQYVINNNMENEIKNLFQFCEKTF